MVENGVIVANVGDTYAIDDIESYQRSFVESYSEPHPQNVMHKIYVILINRFNYSQKL